MSPPPPFNADVWAFLAAVVEGAERPQRMRGRQLRPLVKLVGPSWNYDGPDVARLREIIETYRAEHAAARAARAADDTREGTPKERAIAATADRLNVSEHRVEEVLRRVAWDEPG